MLGPALAGFLLWVLNDAVKTGKRRLYFMARDGYFMYRAALIFCGRFHLPVECRYLSCSRYCVRLPAFHLNQKAALEYICRDALEVTLGTVFSRAGLTTEEMQEVLAVCPFPWSLSEKLASSDLPKIRQKLEHCGRFLHYMNQHSQKEMPNLEGYLRQEGLLDGISDAVVDSGWTGSLQKTLNEVLSCMGRKKSLKGYYWGLYEIPAHVRREDYRCYYFGPRGKIRRKVYFNNCLFEAVYSAPHGMTLGYVRRGELYYPIYEEIVEKRKDFTQKEGSYLMEYVRNLAENTGTFGRKEIGFWQDRKVIEKLFRLFMCRPTGKEAAVFGRIPFSDEGLGREEAPLAAEIKPQDLKGSRIFRQLMHRLKGTKRKGRRSAWQEGSIVLSGKNVNRNLRSYTRYKYLRFLKKEAERIRKETALRHG